MLCIGSHALPWRENPTDIDLICTVDEINKMVARTKLYNNLKHCAPLSYDKYVLICEVRGKDLIHEIEIAHEGSTAAELQQLVLSNPEKLLSDRMADSCLLPREGVPVINTEVAYALKMSHRFLKDSPHFEKTRSDIIKLRDMGHNRIHPFLQDWFARREKETYDYGHPSLKQSKKQFFDTPGVEYKYDHDTIHEAVAIGDFPAYRSFMTDGAEVHCSREKFERLPYEVKLASVIEESMVLAIERCLVPFNFTVGSKDAYKMALQKVCTSISSGWWREFAWWNYDQALEQMPQDFAMKFIEGLMNGTVKEA